jgi:hypothetical protein
MKKRYSEEQIINILAEVESSISLIEVVRKVSKELSKNNLNN